MMIFLLFPFFLINVLAISISELISSDGAVCSIESKHDLVRMVSFEHTDVHYTRMLLELYYDRPLLVRSFFHKCANDSAYLFLHELMPTAESKTIYVKRHVLAVTQQICFKHSDREFVDCSKKVAIDYANHVALAFKVIAEKNMIVIDDIAMKDFSYAESMILRMDQFLKTARVFSAERLQFVTTALTARLVSEKIKQSGSEVPLEFLESSLLGTSDDQIDILATFAKEAFDILSPDTAMLYREFKEVGFNTTSIQNRIAIVERAQACFSTMYPHVNVMIPTKNPTAVNIARCIRSLLTNANLTFGSIRFHFGIDWRDEKTKISIDTVCAAFDATCEIHPVHGRGGDVSVIANHIFAAIDAEEYFLRFNDDTEMLTQNWNVLAIDALRRPPCNIGIAHILDKTNTGLQTHSFVSAMHKRIFGYYFPYHFKNWYEDNWITDVYAGKLTKISGMAITHHATGVRYVMPPMDKDALAFATSSGRKRINNFLLKINAI